MGSNNQRSSQSADFDRQGRRLRALGIGVLAVLASVSFFALKDLGEVLISLAENGTPVLALAALVFAILLGIAKIVEAFGKPMAMVLRIVEIRPIPKDNAQQLPDEVGTNTQIEGGGRA